MRSEKPVQTESLRASLLPVRGRWARYLRSLALVIGAYLALTAGLWLRPMGVYPPCGLDGAIALSLAAWSWRIVSETHPREAHRAGGLVGAATSGWLTAMMAFLLTPGASRGLGLLAAGLAFLLVVPLGALIGGAVWGSRAAAQERKTDVIPSGRFD